MTLLITARELEERRRAAAGPLAPLADSLAADLEPLLERPPEIPRDKARLSRAGGRCSDDGTNLEYDPFAPRRWRCPRCGRVYEDEAHYRYGLMWHHLWLAERAVHAATLFALRGDPRHAALAGHLLDGYAEVYLELPNRDNVLGPSRLFFSTYLESIWLLQICVALDLLRMSGEGRELAERVKERIVAPAVTIIEEYHEGTSNRQAWNVAARIAAALTLGGEGEPLGQPGRDLSALLETALLPDGSWYEGENYHVFAHRGLWYGVMMTERAGVRLDPALVARFDRGFALPFLTALPDFTMLARRDSQYAISLRQWRFAELCELGLARGDDPELRAALAKLYEPDVPHGDTGRARSSAEAERHSPASGLTRADLGWRSLLHARETLPPLAGAVPRSVLLPAQGLAVFRRDAGKLFVSVDYGESGGGHGHPDRLNLVVCDGANRWLDDPGTGSYVDRSLHWYRSTLAHCAPLADRQSQPRYWGELLAYEERGAAGWLRARASIGMNARAERWVVVMDDYVVDQLYAATPRGRKLGLPIHLDADTPSMRWTRSMIEGMGGLEDGFDFVESAEVASPEWPLRLEARQDAARADLWIAAPRGARLWRLVAPGPPGSGPRRFLYVETEAGDVSIVTVLAPRRTLANVEMRDASVVVEHVDGTRHEHAGRGTDWRIELHAGAATSSIELAGAVPSREWPAAAPRSEAESLKLALPDGGPAVELELGEQEYVRSEQTWREAGNPTATVRLAADGPYIRVEIIARTGPPMYIADDAVNEMDNEQPDINASGVQLLVGRGGPPIGWLVRPGADGRARVRPLGAGEVPIDARTVSRADGWEAYISVDRRLIGGTGRELGLALAVNEIPPGRERRRGQLVLGGGPGQWVYLRGDRPRGHEWVELLLDPLP